MGQHGTVGDRGAYVTVQGIVGEMELWGRVGNYGRKYRTVR